MTKNFSTLVKHAHAELFFMVSAGTRLSSSCSFDPFVVCGGGFFFGPKYFYTQMYFNPLGIYHKPTDKERLFFFKHKLVLLVHKTLA